MTSSISLQYCFKAALQIPTGPPAPKPKTICIQGNKNRFFPFYFPSKSCRHGGPEETLGSHFGEPVIFFFFFVCGNLLAK